MRRVRNRDAKALQRLWCGVNVRVWDGGILAVATDEVAVANANDCTKLKKGSEREAGFGSRRVARRSRALSASCRTLSHARR